MIQHGQVTRGVGLSRPRGGARHVPLGLEQRREIDAVEFTRGGVRVVLGARRPNIGPVEEPLAQIFNGFTLREGRIVRIDDYRVGGRRSPEPTSPRTWAGADPRRRAGRALPAGLHEIARQSSA